WQVDSVTIAGCLPPTPELELTKTVGTDPGQCATTDAIAVAPGTDVTYCYTIQNTGDITVTTHDLVDDQLGTLLTGFVYNLPPGASAFITATTTILVDTVNEGSWTGTTLYGDSVTATDTAIVTVGFDVYLPIITNPSTITHLPATKPSLGWVPWLILGPMWVIGLRQKKGKG
ncbi:MAG: hypothetical protein HUU38_07705, partial [Anaerolineales bacterium]|nr:hypothetical protein [Anaerolineales bacterium]